MEYKVTKLNRGEKPCREELYELFITQNLPIRVLCELYNRTEPIITKWLRSYNINKDRKTTAECSKNTCMQRYGAVSATGTPETQQKYKQTCLELYGVDNAMKNSTIADKVKDTVLQKYGVENIMQYEGIAQQVQEVVKQHYKGGFSSQEIRQKTEQTCLQKFGETTNLKCPETKDKIKATVKQKYGTDYITQTEEFKHKVKITCLRKYGCTSAMKSGLCKLKSKDTCLRKYGTPYVAQRCLPQQTKELIQDAQRLKEFIESLPIKTPTYVERALGYKNSTSHDSIITICKRLGIQDCLDMRKTQAEEEIRVYLQELGFDFVKTRKVIAPFEIDLYNEDLKLGIEFNGVFWHSDQRMPNNYHQLKYKMCKEQGIRLIQIWEWEWLNDRDKCKSILSCACGCCKRLYARMCDVQPITNVVYKKFLQQNSIHGYRPAKVLLGLYFKQELVQVMSFGNAYLSHSKYQWEVIRSSTKLFTTVVGGQSKLLKYFEKSYNPKSILFYIDVDKFTGASLQNMGFEFSHLSKPGYKLSDGVNVLNRNPGKNTLQKQQIKEGRLHKVYNAGTECYVKILDSFL